MWLVDPWRGTRQTFALYAPLLIDQVSAPTFPDGDIKALVLCACSFSAVKMMLCWVVACRAAVERWGSIDTMLRNMRTMKELPQLPREGVDRLPNWSSS